MITLQWECPDFHKEYTGQRKITKIVVYFSIQLMYNILII